MAQILLGGPDGLDLLAAPYEAQVGTDWGMWQAITSQTSSLFLDGSVVAGESSGNRTVKLQVQVTAPKGWRAHLVAACEALFAEANKQANELWFVPDDGATVVYQVFRAQPERTDDQSEAWLRRTYTFTFPARPYLRSATQRSLSVAAPGVLLEGFENGPSGVDLFNNGSAAWQRLNAAGGSDTPATLFAGTPAGLTSLTNCTAAIGTFGGQSGVVQLTATADGLVEAAQDVAFAVTGAVAAVSIGGFYNDGGAAPEYVAGVEWRDASDTLLRVDYSDPQPAVVGNVLSSRATGPHFVAVRPPTATKARIRMRVPAAVAGKRYWFAKLTIADVAAYSLYTSGTLPTSTFSVAHDGTHGLLMIGSDGFAYGTLAAPIDISAMPCVSFWTAYATSVAQDLALTLYDSAGRWSRWLVPVPATGGAAKWQRMSVDLSAPTTAGADGACVLSAVTGWSFTGQLANWAFDTIVAGSADSALVTEHGQVAAPAVVGSARTTVALSVLGRSGATMSDVLLAVADPDVLPMLPSVSSVATANAPAAYAGVYRVLAALVPAASKTAPTCVVNQMIGGVSVATQTLTGTMQPGNRYCDFGSVALPLVGVPSDNLAVSYTFTLAPTGNWAEVLVLDVDQPMAWHPNLSTAHARVWVDEPVSPAPLGLMYVGDAEDRSDARVPLTPPDLSLPFQVAAPSVNLLIYSTSGAPEVDASPYWPRWLVEPAE